MLLRSVGRSGEEDGTLSKIADQITPRPQTQVRFLTRPSSPDTGMRVIRVEVGTHPPYWCTTKGIVIRHGDQDRIADLATIEHLIERRTGGSYAVEQAKQQNWFAPIQGLATTDPTIVRAVVGPVDLVPRPPLSPSL